MKNIITIVLFVITTTIFIHFTVGVSAQGMMGVFNSSPDNSDIKNQQQEELEGKRLLDNLNNKISTCQKLNNSDFEKIGEYFMGQSIGDTQRHIVMNGMMKRMMGEKGEEQAHEALGKRLSGCDPAATFPMQHSGYLPMMGMLGMVANHNQLDGKSFGMMGNIYTSGYSILGAATWVLVIAFLILGIAHFLKELKKE